MANGKTFTTKGLTALSFLSLTKEEHALVRKMRNDPSVREWMYGRHLISASEHSAFIRSLRSSKKAFYWLVRGGKNDYYGVISVVRYDKENSNAYLGIYANPFLGKKGKGSVLMRVLKHIAFKLMRLRTLKLEVVETNKKAIRFYKKQGFLIEGKLKNFARWKGKRADVIIMGAEPR